MRAFILMKIGLMSDTHGDVERTIRAARLLRVHHVGAVIHCGDIGSQRVLVELAGIFEPPHIPVYAVLGNMDHDEYIGAGVELCDRLADLELGGKSIAVIHGDDYARLRQAIVGQQFDYIFTGHSHAREDHREGRTRIINPGAVTRASHPGVAVLDTSTDTLTWYNLP
jgi:putative phosphoesterase